jgi:hypothetical protein
MDEDRRIRFLVAPILFVASLLWGALSNRTARDFIVEVLKNPDWSKVIGLIAGGIAGGGVVLFAAGYVIGTLAYFFLRLLFRCRLYFGKSRFHEVAMSDDAFKQVWKILGASGVPDRLQELSAGVAFDHDVLRKNHEGIHQWMFRRWNAFSIATTSFCGLVLSFPFGHAFGIPLSRTWWLPVSVFAVILVFVMVWAWRDTMNMLDFMVRLPPKENEAKDASHNES